MIQFIACWLALSLVVGPMLHAGGEGREDA